MKLIETSAATLALLLFAVTAHAASHPLAARVAKVAPGKAAPTAPTCDLSITAPQRNGGPRFGPFSAAGVEDLLLSARVRGADAGPHVLSVKLYMPAGFFYQQLDLAVAGQGRAAGQRRLDRYPYPVSEKPAQVVQDASGKQLKVDMAIPVGGTDISRNSLYGTWQASVFLDGSTSACAAPLSFVINP